MARGDEQEPVVENEGQQCCKATGLYGEADLVILCDCLRDYIDNDRYPYSLPRKCNAVPEPNCNALAGAA